MGAERIVIVEDERDMADLVARRLEREGYVVETVHDGSEALEHILSSPPDLVLLDLMLPGMPGTDVATALGRDPRTADVPVIMLTAKSEESDVVVGLRLGADDYVTKPFSMSILVARVAAVLRRRGPAEASLGKAISIGSVTIDRERHEVTVDGESVSLTTTEFRLLAALAAANGRVLTRYQLIDRAIGQNTVVTDRTVDVHLTALRRKLGPARALVKTVRGVGYRLSAGEPEE